METAKELPLTALPTLDEIRAQASETFPVKHLRECRSALCFFGAAFIGRNAEVFLATDLKIPLATVIDSDPVPMSVMQRVYGEEHPLWLFLRSDAYEFAEDLLRAEKGPIEDVVTVDPWTQDIPAALERLDLWASLAKKRLVIGARTDDLPAAPDGWTLIDRRKRSDHAGGIYWLVYARNGA